MAGLHVTDHAIVRFLERAGGMDVEGLRLRIQASLNRAHAAARELSASDYLVRVDGMIFVVRSDKVTSILPEGTEKERAFALRPGAHGQS